MEPSSDRPDLVSTEEAVRLLEVAPSRIQVMVDEGLLTPVDQGGERRFRRGEVLALRDLGG